MSAEAVGVKVCVSVRAVFRQLKRRLQQACQVGRQQPCLRI